MGGWPFCMPGIQRSARSEKRVGILSRLIFRDRAKRPRGEGLSCMHVSLMNKDTGFPACRLPAAGRAGRQKGRFFCLQYQIIRLLDPAVRGFFSSKEKNNFTKQTNDNILPNLILRLCSIKFLGVTLIFISMTSASHFRNTPMGRLFRAKEIFTT